MTDSAQIIQSAVDAARSAATQLSFYERAQLLLSVAEDLRDGLDEDVTGGGPPEGRPWELDAIAPVIDAAQSYVDAARAAKR